MSVNDLIENWVRAQERGDVEELTRLAVGDFTLVGPLGFVLTRDQWLAQYRSNALKTRSLQYDDIRVREYGDTAIVICAQAQEATYDGNPANGTFRVTHIAVRDSGGEWRLAGMHFSPIAPPPR